MPRSGDEYSLPAGTAAVSGTPANSTHVNARFSDLAEEQNLVRPISKGGTGATTAAGILAATGVTASVAEVNVLDGITATTAELNILDGVTATTAELNILDGATLTVTELNYVDGVTSPIQVQLNGKVSTIADPGADRIRFWDDSAGAEAYLEVGSGLQISGTTLSAVATGWEDVETLTMTGTTVNTSVFEEGYSYRFLWRGVAQGSGATRGFHVAFNRGTSGLNTAGRFSGQSINSNRWFYGDLYMVRPMTANTLHMIQGWGWNSLVDPAAGGSDETNTDPAGRMVTMTSAETITFLRFTVEAGASFTSGTVLVQRKAE